jgi:hypothetical protein
VNEASAELAEYSKVARLGRRPLLKKSMALSESIAFATVLGAGIHVLRFFQPLQNSGASVCGSRKELTEADYGLHVAPGP